MTKPVNALLVAPPRKPALIAGISLLVMAVAAAFAYGYVHSSLIAEGDPGGTFSNLLSSKALFMAGIGSWILILLLDIVAAVALFQFFKKVNYNLSLFTASLRLVYSAILALAIYYLISVVPLLTPSGTSNSLGSGMADAKIASFRVTWSMGLILFGVHLLGLGYLSLRSGFVPRILGYLLVFAGLSYTFIHFGKNFFTGFASQINTLEMILSLPLAIAEIGFALWLVIRGGRSMRKTTV